jgi:hypothetical protein
MSDRFVCQIMIGGDLNEQTPRGLMHAAELDAAKTEWDGGTADEQCFYDAIAAAQQLRFYDSQASAWQFENLERFCQGNGLSFQRHRAAAHECDAEFFYRAPGMQQPRYAKASQDGNEVLVSLDDLEEALASGSGLSDVIATAKGAMVDVPPLRLTAPTS